MNQDFDKTAIVLPSDSIIVKLHVPGNPKILSLIRRILCAISIPFGLPGKFVDDIKLATTEACTNVIKHAFKYDQTKSFRLSVMISKTFLEIHIYYFDSVFYPEKILPPDLSHMREGGLGVFIMRNIMDEVVYTVDRPEGNVLLKMKKTIGQMDQIES